MNIEQVWIQRYGPLQADIEPGRQLSLVHGPNESGKTLLVEAIMKLLLGEDAVPDARVDEHPEGFVVLSGDFGEHKLAGDQTLVDLYETEYGIELTPRALRNIFVIRDADLRIDEEDEFYERVTDRVTGIRTQDIRRVMEALRGAGRLTDRNLNISSSASNDDAGDQLEMARELRADIREYLDTADEEGLAAIERRRLEARATKQELEAEHAELEAAKEAAEFEALVEATDTLESALDDLGSLPDEETLSGLAHRIKQFDAGEREELEDRKARYSTLAKWAIGAGVVTFGALAVAGFPAVAVVGPLLGFGLAAYFASRMRGVSASIEDLATARSAIINEAHRLGLAAEELAAVRGELDRIEDERASLNRSINESVGFLRTTIGLSAAEPPAVLEEAREYIETRAAEIETDLDREFSEAELKSIETELTDVEAEIAELDRQLEEHQRQLRVFSDRAHQLDFRTFTGEALDLQVSNLDALETLEERVAELIDAIEADARYSRRAHEVFERLEATEEEKVRELFGDESPATKLFGRITDDRYERVRYDEAANQLVVERANDQQFTPAELSKGTRDQLYLCVRVALAQELPDLDAGFFLMDDAFLAADVQRLERQVEVLRELAADGWQTIYFTAKPEAIEAIEPHVEEQVYELQELA